MTLKQIKVVVDTSVFIAALLSKNPDSNPNQVLNAWRNGKFTLVTSPQLLQELVIVLSRQTIPLTEIQNLITIIAKISLFIPGAYEATRLDSIDPKDNIFLAAAYEAKADYLVSLDAQHLLPLKHYHGTQIINPELFIKVLN